MGESRIVSLIIDELVTTLHFPLQHQLGESFPASDLKVKPHIHIRTEPLPNIRAWQQAVVTIPCPYAGDAGQCGHQAAQVQGAGARPQPGDQRRHHTRHHRQAAVRAGGMSGAPVVWDVMYPLRCQRNFAPSPNFMKMSRNFVDSSLYI